MITDTECIIGILAWSVCDHEGRRRLVTRKGKETTLVAIVKQYAMLRERQHADYQEFQPGGTRLQQTTTWLGPPTDPPAGVHEMEVKEQRREAAPTARRRATQLAQGSTMEIDIAQLLQEFDAVYAWTHSTR